MGPPFVMGLSVGRDVSMSPPDESKISILCYQVGVSQTSKDTLSLSRSALNKHDAFMIYEPSDAEWHWLMTGANGLTSQEMSA